MGGLLALLDIWRSEEAAPYVLGYTYCAMCVMCWPETARTRHWVLVPVVGAVASACATRGRRWHGPWSLQRYCPWRPRRHRFSCATLVPPDVPAKAVRSGRLRNSAARMSRAGASIFNESETVAKFEIMDGAPAKGESIPVRLFLGGFRLCPTYTHVCAPGLCTRRAPPAHVHCSQHAAECAVRCCVAAKHNRQMCPAQHPRRPFEAPCTPPQTPHAPSPPSTPFHHCPNPFDMFRSSCSFQESTAAKNTAGSPCRHPRAPKNERRSFRRGHPGAPGPSMKRRITCTQKNGFAKKNAKKVVKKLFFWLNCRHKKI